MSLVIFFAAGQQPEMSPEEYLKRNLGSSDGRLPWLLSLLYVLLALTLVSWAGMRHSNRSRRGRALFIFTARHRADRARVRVLPAAGGG